MKRESQCLRRGGGKRTESLSTTKVAPDRGQEALCLGVVKDRDGRAGKIDIDDKAHTAVEVLQTAARGQSVR